MKGAVTLRKRYKLIITVLAAILIVFSGFIIWAETPPSPTQEAYDTLNSDTKVEVIQGNTLVFKPINTNYTTGFIFYPGGRVNYLAYAPYAHAIAAQGYLVIIVQMPLNLAIFGINLANDVIAANPNITSWGIGGHSLGGSMAAQYIHDNPGKIEGLALWASYPPSGIDLSTSNITVTSIHGSNDGLVSTKQIDDSLRQLPSNTIRVEIDGGNHAQFGWYGTQSGDNTATINHEEQQSITINATVRMLQELH